jgi:hypothetical protein
MVPGSLLHETAQIATKLEAYYQTLKDFEHQRAFQEGAISVIFERLMRVPCLGCVWVKLLP